MILNLGVRGGVLFTELNSDARGSIALSTTRRYPYDFTRYRNFVGLIHKVEQHENFVANVVGLICGDEEAAVLKVGHVCRIQHSFVFNRQREDAIATTLLLLTHLPHLSKLICPDSSTIRMLLPLLVPPVSPPTLYTIADSDWRRQ